MTNKPADVFGLPFGKLEVGAPADLVLIDLKRSKQLIKKHLYQKEKTHHLTAGHAQGGQ